MDVEPPAGIVEGIFIAGTATVLPLAVDEAAAMEGTGLAGDRYAAGVGTYSRGPTPGRQVTLIEAEALDRLADEHGVVVTGAEARRNVVTRGIALEALIGRGFTIGEVELVGVRDCPPCAHLQKLTGAPVVAGLAGRGGLRADIVRGGTLRVGDPVRVRSRMSRSSPIA